MFDLAVGSARIVISLSPEFVVVQSSKTVVLRLSRPSWSSTASLLKECGSWSDSVFGSLAFARY
jgi:hypothetical protein